MKAKSRNSVLGYLALISVLCFFTKLGLGAELGSGDPTAIPVPEKVYIPVQQQPAPKKYYAPLSASFSLEDTSPLKPATAGGASSSQSHRTPSADAMTENANSKPMQLSQPDKEQLDKIIDDVWNKVRDSGLPEADKFLEKLSNRDFEDLAENKDNDREVHSVFKRAFREAIEEALASSGISQNLRTFLRGQQVEMDLAVERITSNAGEMQQAYGLFADRIHEVTEGLGLSGFSQTSPNVLESSVFLRGFSARARRAISQAYIHTAKNMKNKVAADPFEKSAIAAEEELNAQILEDPMSLEIQQFELIDFVTIDNNYLLVQKLLNPPAEMHPYFKWLFYTRKLTPTMVDNYLDVRSKILRLYTQAKEGNGLIRYKGKVHGHGPFLPFAENAASNYELVRAVPQV